MASSFAEVLTETLAARGWSHGQLARELGMTRGAVSAWVRGESEPEANRVFKIEGVLGLPPGTLSTHLGFRPTAGQQPGTLAEAIQDVADVEDELRLLLLDVIRVYEQRISLSRHVLRSTVSLLLDLEDQP